MHNLFVQFEQNDLTNFNDLHETDLQVDTLVINPNHLIMLFNDVIDRLILKINQKLMLTSKSALENETTYNEKLAYLQRIARSRGKPVC